MVALCVDLFIKNLQNARVVEKRSKKRKREREIERGGGRKRKKSKKKRSAYTRRRALTGNGGTFLIVVRFSNARYYSSRVPSLRS